MATQLHRLLHLLFLPFVLFGRGATPPQPSQHTVAGDDDPGQHPVVLLPGNTCSQLEARLTDAYQPPPASPQCAAAKGSGRWFRLWKNSTAMQDPDVAPCLTDQLRLVYDTAARDFRNVPGVETRVLGFGSTRGFLADTPANKALVERASRKNGGKPVVIVSHSQGGYFALEFLNRSPLQWRRRHIRHYIMASTSAGGFLLSMRQLASDPGATLSSGTAFTALPSPTVFGPGAPLVVTRDRNYTAPEMPEFLAAIGAPPLAVTLYETRALPVKLNFRAPVVPTTCVNGFGVPAMKELVYWDGNFSKDPEVVYGDGDGLLLSVSTLALDTVIGGDPRQEYYKSIRLPSTSHAGVVSDGAALERVVSEILGRVH